MRRGSVNGYIWIRLAKRSRGGFLSPRQRAEMMALLRDGHAEQRSARRANAMLLLDDGWSCEKVAEALYLDDDAVRGWLETYDAEGLEGLRRFGGGGSASHLSAEQTPGSQCGGIEAMYSLLAMIHVFLDNARHHHAVLAREWLAQPGRRVQLHFIPAHCPHSNPIERLWGLMHKHLTHNKTHPTHRGFADAMLHFLRNEVPRRWGESGDSITVDFRVIRPASFPILA